MFCNVIDKSLSHTTYCMWDILFSLYLSHAPKPPFTFSLFILTFILVMYIHTSLYIAFHDLYLLYFHGFAPHDDSIPSFKLVYKQSKDLI